MILIEVVRRYLSPMGTDPVEAVSAVIEGGIAVAFGIADIEAVKEFGADPVLVGV